MKTVSQSELYTNQSRIFDTAQRTPVSVVGRGGRVRAVIVSPNFFASAVEALEDRLDIQAASAARNELGSISHEELKQELGLA